MDSVTVVLDRWINLEGSWARAWKEHQYELVRMYQEQKIRDQARSRG
jgi:hypothetical protein